MSSICSSNLTSGFIDLATFDEQEKYLYGGPDAVAYFVRETRKSTWFTIVPVVLSRASGQPQFGQEWSVTISRAGDYLVQTWLRVTIPEVQLAPTNAYAADGRLRWTRNLMHNLVRECAITFNDLVAARFDNYHLDLWTAFTVPAGKRLGYNNMVGNIAELISPHDSNTPIPSVTLNLPLPFFYTRDSGVALPTASLPYNDIRITFSFRSWQDLLILDNVGVVPPGTPTSTVPQSRDLVVSEPQLQCVQVWSNYAIVSSDERKRMACAPRDILIEQVQTAPIQTYIPAQNPMPSYDIRFSHSIKALFFACRNKTTPSEWSNYSTASPIPTATGINFYPPNAVDPILNTSLIYESTSRLACMGSDYYSLVNPYYHAPVIPLETGYHVYSYSLDFFCLDPMGSTNYGKLTNVSIVPQASPKAVEASTGIQTNPDGTTTPIAVQKFDFITTAVNYNIVRISGELQCAAAKSELPCGLRATPTWENSLSACAVCC